MLTTGLYWWLGIFETCNVIQPNQANPCCWGLHRFFWGSQRHIQKKIIRFPFCLFSNTYFLETSFYTIWFYIGLFPGRSTRTFEVRLFWSRLGYLSTRKNSHSWFHKEVIAVKRRLLSHLCSGWSIRIPSKSCCQIPKCTNILEYQISNCLHKPPRRFSFEWKSDTSPWSLCRQSWVHSMSLMITSWVCRQGWK